MRLLFYAPPFNASARALYKNLCALKGVRHSEYIGSMHGLIKTLRTPLGMSTIGVLWPADEVELSKLLDLRYLLRDMRLVLVLPDHQPQTISDGHLLRPRFACQHDGDLADIASVVTKIISSRQPSALQIAT